MFLIIFIFSFLLLAKCKEAKYSHLMLWMKNINIFCDTFAWILNKNIVFKLLCWLWLVLQTCLYFHIKCYIVIYKTLRQDIWVMLEYFTVLRIVRMKCPSSLTHSVSLWGAEESETGLRLSHQFRAKSPKIFHTSSGRSDFHKWNYAYRGWKMF